MQNPKNLRPDYDYYEDSLGDAYDDYDELDSESDDDDNDAYTGEYDETDPEDEENSDDEGDPDEDDPEGSEDSFPEEDDITIDEEIADEDNTDGKEYRYSTDYLIELMDKYHNGDEEDKKDVRNQFCIMLTPLIKRMIRISRGVDDEYIDYIQHCYLYICKRLDRFDPTKSFAFNYFKYVIKEAISACHESSYGKSSHEMNIDRKVIKQIREFESMGVNPSPSRIAGETGLSVRQVEDALERIQAEKLVLGEDMTVYEDKSRLPLDAILKNEVSETLQHAIMQLPDLEREAILLSYNFYEMDKECSNKKIAELLHVSELKVKELLISAKKHLKRDFSLDQLLGRSKRISHRTYHIKESDPARFSFDSESDAFLNLDADEDEVIEVGKNDNQNVQYLIHVVDIDFSKY